MVSPEIMTNLGTLGENPQRPEMGRQHQQQSQHSTQGKYNQTSFPYRDYRYHELPRQTRFNEKQNQLYSPLSLCPLHLHSLQDLTCLVALYNATC